MADDESQREAPNELPAATPVGETPANPAGPPIAYAPGDLTDELSLPNPLVVAGIGLLLLAVVTFLPTLRGQPTWLDDVSFTDNPFVQVAGGVARFWDSADRAGRYQPLTLTSFWLEYRLFHESLIAAHFVNVLLHAAVVLLLWTLLRKLEVPGAWFAAAVFAVHPVHTQAIAWISGRSVVLASMFYLSGMLVYLRYLGVNPPVEQKTLLTLPPEPERLWGLAFALFVCGMASKAAATVTFPIAILLVVWWKRGTVAAKDAVGLIPFFIAAIAGGAWVGWMQYNAPQNQAVRVTFGPLSIADRLHIGFRAIWFYAEKIVAPYPLIFDYPRWKDVLGPGAICGFGLIIVFIALWIMRGRMGRGAIACASLFVVAILPMLNLLDPPALRYSFVADNRQYLASAALIVLIASLGTQLVMNEKWRDKVNPSYCAGAVLIVLAILSFHQGTFYLTNTNLWKSTISANGASVLADDGYGDALLSQGVFDVAGDWYAHAQSIAPNDPRAAVGLGTVAAAEAFDERTAGDAASATTRETSAKQYFQDAIALDPDYKPAYTALAELLSIEHDDRGAINALNQAVRIEPDSMMTRLKLGAAQRRVGDLRDAQDTLTDLLEDAPNIAAVHSELGNVYMQEENPQAALPEWQKAIQLDPTDTAVMLNFGYLLASSGETELAAKQFQAATMIDPSLVKAHVALAQMYTKLGHRHDAVDQLTQAMGYAPGDSAIKAALAAAQKDEKDHGAGTPASSQPSSEPTTGE